MTRTELLALRATWVAERTAALAERARLVEELAAQDEGLLVIEAAIADIDEQLANLPADTGWDPTSPTHAFVDGFGLKQGPAGNVNDWEARSARSARVVQTYPKEAVFMGGVIQVPEQVQAGTARWLMACSPFKSWKRLAAPDLARVDADARLVNGWPTSAAGLAAIAKFAGFVDKLGPLSDALIVRLMWEQNAMWTGPEGWFIRKTTNVSDAQAKRLSNSLVDGTRRIREVVMWAVHDRIGRDRYSKLTWAFNLAGSQMGDPRNLALIERAWPRAVPPGTQMLVTVDDFAAEPHSGEQLAAVLAKVDDLAVRLPNVVGVGIDEFGPGLKLQDMDAAEVAAAQPEMVAAVRVLMDWARNHAAAGTLSHVCPVETAWLVNQRWSATILTDRDRKPNGQIVPLIAPGMERASFAGRNDEVVPSNNPGMAEAFLAGLDA